jgi:hypothetical protein
VTRWAWRGLALLLAVSAAGCASGLSTALERPIPPPALRFGVDTFAFRNESREKNEGKPGLYANYCFVMARAVRQFHSFARFDPAAPRLASAAYVDLVRKVVARRAWEAPLPLEGRVVIPGYASLFELTAFEEEAVKTGLGGYLWTMFQWTNWRVTFPVTGRHQESVVAELIAELEAGQPMQLLVTNLPRIELNHTVLAYAYYPTAAGDLVLLVYDPNDPDTPGILTFSRAERRFVATALWDTEAGPIRAYRVYYGFWL